MEIKIGDLKRAYVSKDGDISVSNLVFKIVLFDATAMMPDMNHDRWRVYTPFDVKEWMEPGSRVKVYLGFGFKVPKGFVLYMYLNPLYHESLEMEEFFVTPGDTDEVVIELKCLRSFYLRKYMLICCFVIIPVLNTDEREMLYVKPRVDEYR
jgi:hypothetical protein